MTPRQRMRTLIARRGYTMVPGAYDTLTARLVEQAGFEAVYLTGGGYSRANGSALVSSMLIDRFLPSCRRSVAWPLVAARQMPIRRYR